MKHRKNIAIIGATSAIAEHCARLWVNGTAVDLTLVGRDRNRLEPIATDLQTRSPESRFTIVETQFLDPQAIADTVNAITPDEPIDIALIAHGSLPDQSSSQKDLSLCRDALEINAISPVLFAEAFAARMEKAGYGNIAIIGSVAGDRGRKSNYIYGAAKGLLTRHAEGLRHRLAASGVKVTLIKPGPVDTPMTANLKAMKRAPVTQVAADIVKAVDRGQSVLYTPGKWRLIMTIIRMVPEFVFHKTNL